MQVCEDTQWNGKMINTKSGAEPMSSERNESECLVRLFVQHPSKFIHKIEFDAELFWVCVWKFNRHRATTSCHVCRHINPKLNKDSVWRRGLTCELETDYYVCERALLRSTLNLNKLTYLDIVSLSQLLRFRKKANTIFHMTAFLEPFSLRHVN